VSPHAPPAWTFHTRPTLVLARMASRSGAGILPAAGVWAFSGEWTLSSAPLAAASRRLAREWPEVAEGSGGDLRGGNKAVQFTPAGVKEKRAPLCSGLPGFCPAPRSSRSSAGRGRNENCPRPHRGGATTNSVTSSTIIETLIHNQDRALAATPLRQVMRKQETTRRFHRSNRSPL